MLTKLSEDVIFPTDSGEIITMNTSFRDDAPDGSHKHFILFSAVHPDHGPSDGFILEEHEIEHFIFALRKVQALVAVTNEKQ